MEFIIDEMEKKLFLHLLTTYSGYWEVLKKKKMHIIIVLSDV